MNLTFGKKADRILRTLRIRKDSFIESEIPRVKSFWMNSPEFLSLSEEEVVGIALGEEIREESECKVLSEESMSFEHTKFLKEGQYDVLFSQVEDGESEFYIFYMLRPLKINAFLVFWAVFSL